VTLFIINDLDRPTPTKRILSIFATRYPEARAGTVLVATGAHRIAGSVDAVGGALLGDLYPSFAGRFLIHDAVSDPMEHLGATSRTTPVEISRRFLEHETVVAIGSVEPHWFAGHTGGRKSLVPGIAAFETIRLNHRLALHAGAAPLATVGNPVHEDLTDAARLALARHADRYRSDAGISFVNTVGRDDSVFSVAVGSLDSSCGLWDSVDAIYRKESPALDIAVAVASAPMDRTLYQAMKSFENIRVAIKPGGTYILVACCVDGLGPADFSETLGLSDDTELVANHLRGEYRLGDHKFIHPLEFMGSGGSMMVVSKQLAGADRKGKVGFFSRYDSIDSALSAATARRGASDNGTGDRRIGIFMDAVNLVTV
jgi:nickel-dependent lactate racemase